MRSHRALSPRPAKVGLGRGRGQVWGDRYHRRDLTNARQVRNAVVYCLQNYKKHQRIQSGASRIDPCSSARSFQGWTAIRQHDDGPRPTEEARTVLLGTAWQKHGFIHPGEAPRAPN
jgi:putative transposase